MTVQLDAERIIESGDMPVENNEVTPLLRVSPSAASLEILKNDTTEPFFVVAKKETKWIFSSSLLVSLTLVLQASIFFANTISIGHFGAKELSAMSLAILLLELFVIAPSFGLLSAMDTFCSTAFTASRDKTLVGFHFQRSLIAMFLLVIITTPILWYSESILLAIKQDSDIAHLCGIYLRINIIGIPPMLAFEACIRYLQAQEIMRAGTIIVMFIAPIHWFCNIFFVRSPTYGIGFIGAPIVTVISNWLMFIGILIYIRFSRAIETWGGWDISAFYNMSEYFKLALPAIVTVCAEWSSIQLLVIGVSYFGANQLAANAIMINTGFLVYQFSNGVGFGSSPRIGNLIGAAKPRQARIAAKMALLAAGLIGLTGTLFLLFCGDWWTLVYTSDPDVIRETAKLIPVLCTLIVSDGLNAILSAILRGLGRQKVGANIFLFAYYVCAVPIGLYLGYVLNMQAVGLWWGLCSGMMMACLFQIYYIFKKVDWNDEVRLCLIRLQNDSNSALIDAENNILE